MVAYGGDGSSFLLLLFSMGSNHVGDRFTGLKLLVAGVLARFISRWLSRGFERYLVVVLLDWVHINGVWCSIGVWLIGGGQAWMCTGSFKRLLGLGAFQ
ncbi:unnamed protein product [Amaranthus hypochondriacus]